MAGRSFTARTGHLIKSKPSMNGYEPMQWKHDHTYLDYYSAMVDERGALRQELTDDGIHATENGYAVMAPLAEQAIATARKKKS